MRGKNELGLVEAYSDLTKLTDGQLEAYLRKLLNKRIEAHNSGYISFSVSEIMTLLVIAAAEKNSRSSAKIATAALVIGAASVFVALIGAFT